MKKIVSVLLTVLLLLSLAPLANVQAVRDNRLPEDVLLCEIMERQNDAAKRADLLIVPDRRYTAATPELSVSVVYGGENEQTVEFGAAFVSVTTGSYRESLENQTTFQCQQLLVPLESAEAEIASVRVAAGSFTDRNGRGNPAWEINAPRCRSTWITLYYDSKVCADTFQFDYSYLQNPGIGEGDPLHIYWNDSYPLTVVLDGEPIGELPGGPGAAFTFPAPAAGDHVLTFLFEGMECGWEYFEVFTQREVYKRQLDAAKEEVDAFSSLIYMPLIAVPAFLTLPPLGLAALSGPFWFFLQVFNYLAAAFRVFNLFK